jgi:hypothetical protein|tara:strand:+ start:489 stop:1631 length:1143 start_codon:yes stop_codon:yes gene_type:complete
MATYSPLATAIISLATASFERQGFGIPLFITPHRFTEDRVLIVTADSYQTDLPVGSDAYAAAATSFAQPNGLSQLYIGRVEADAEITVPVAPTENETYSFTIEVNDGDSLEVTHTAGATPTQESVLGALETAINGDTDVAAHVTATLSGTGASAKLTITTVSTGDFFLLSDLVKLEDTYVATETATEAFTAISAENNNFYGVGTSDKTEAWLLELAAVVNAVEKQFWTTVSDTGALSALADPATDTLGKLQAGNYLRVVSGYHQDAETTFPEMGALAFNLPFPAGSIVWGNAKTSGIGASRDADGKKLGVTEKQALLDRNAFFWDEQGGAQFLNSDVKTSSGERPENVRGKDNMVVDIQAAVSELLLNQVGRKLPLKLAA